MPAVCFTHCIAHLFQIRHLQVGCSTICHSYTYSKFLVAFFPNCCCLLITHFLPVVLSTSSPTCVHAGGAAAAQLSYTFSAGCQFPGKTRSSCSSRGRKMWRIKSRTLQLLVVCWMCEICVLSSGLDTKWNWEHAVTRTCFHSYPQQTPAPRSHIPGAAALHVHAASTSSNQFPWGLSKLRSSSAMGGNIIWV